MSEDPGHQATHSHEGVSHTLEIVVPADTMSTRLDMVAQAFRGQARLPGFRQGKAPLSMIRQKFGDEIRKRVLDDTIPEFLGKELDARELRPVDSPELQELDFELGGDLTFSVRFDTAPEVSISADTELALVRPAVEVTDKMVDESLAELRDQAARLVPAEEDEVSAGMFARCDIALLPKDGKGKKLAEESRFVAVGEEKAIPGLNDQLPGMNIGEEREFVTQLAEGYPNDLLAGKEVRCRVRVEELKQRHLPALDDDLAKDLGIEDLQALRAEVRADLQRQLEARAERRVEDQLLEQLRGANPVDVPRSLVERRLEEMVRRFANDLARQGVDPREAIDWRAFRTEQRPAAVDSLADEMLLDRVAADAGIEVDEQAVQAEIRRQVENRDGGNSRPVASVVQQMRKDGSFERLRLTLQRRSALEHLKARATIEPESGDGIGAEKGTE